MKATDRFPSSARRLAAVLIGLLIGGGACLAQTPSKAIVADVIPVGNHQMATQRITSLLKIHPGAEYSQSVVDEDVRTLYQTKQFKDVQVRLQDAGEGKVIVYFQLTEHPNRIEDIQYLGAKRFSKEDLDGITGLHKGQPLNPIANQIARQAILRKYTQEKGRLLASVELIEGDKPTDTRVIFRITEGNQIKVSSISFTGVSFVTPARLRTQLNSSAAFLGVLGGEYNPMMVESDVSKLIEYYKTFGFHDVRVSRELVLEPDSDRVKLIYHVDEGRRYRLGTVQLDGPKDIPRDRLMTYIDTRAKKGDYYSEDIIRASMNDMKDDQGFRGIDAAVHRELTFKDNGEVDVRYEMTERPAAKVGQIIIYGNKVTKQNVILRQIPLYPGQVLTYPDLRVAERNLARLNIFEADQEKGIRPTVEVLDPDGPNPIKDIAVHVEETRTGSLMFGLGVNSDAGLSGSIVLNERNFDILRPPTSLDDLLSGRAWRGAGQEFRAEAVPGTQFQRYTVSFREPFLFDTPYSLGISAYYYDRLFNEYTETRLGARVTLGRRLNDFWSVSGTIRAEDVGVHDVQPFEPIQITEDEGQHFIVGMRGALSRDSRDSFLRPTAGSLVEVSAEEVVGAYNFPILSLEANKYWTVYQRADGSGRWVVAARSQTSWCGSNAPVFERFYAGGFRSLRGFEFRGVGPSINGFKIGGDFMFLNSLELQIPILANDNLYAVTFLDTGTVEQNVSISDYRVSVGFGLRIVVPMLGPVPIALDFGFPIVKESFDNKQVFSFWVGFFN
jgi:outer membrane protein assembly complex protein YaeT